MTTVMQTMMKPVHEEAGLGSPPEPFTMNASETVTPSLSPMYHTSRAN